MGFLWVGMLIRNFDVLSKSLDHVLRIELLRVQLSNSSFSGSFIDSKHLKESNLHMAKASVDP